jgi:hypothetical protein
MTEAEIKRAEREAETDAEWLGLLLLLAFRKKRAADVTEVRFDAATGRFYLNGRAVSVRSIRAYLTRIEDRMARRLVQTTTRLEKGEITLAEWKREFDRTVTSTHILAGALALGGISVAARNGFTLERIAEQLVYADRFAEDVRKGRAGSLAKMRSRAKQYARAAHITFSNAEQLARQALGVQREAMRIRRAAESCRPCIKFSNKWMPIEAMPPIGSFPKEIGGCAHYCRCYLVYR